MYQDVKFINGGFHYEERDGKYYPLKLPYAGGGGGGGISSSKFRTKRVSHTITQADINNKTFSVQITWDTPFEDGNYTAVWSVNDLGSSPNGFDFIPIDMHSKTATGFTANLFSGSDAPVTQPGDIVIVNAIAIHD